jgi:hypothetical protein
MKVLIESPNKAEITTLVVISANEEQIEMVRQKIKSRFGFHQSANTLGAQHLAHHPAVFHYTDGLEIRAKSPLSGLL